MYDSRLLRNLIALALDEDLAFGDLTGQCVPAGDQEAKAKILSRERLVLCGIGVVPLIFRELGIGVKFETLANDGDTVEAEQSLAIITGPLSAILAAERTLLNFIQRLSGIASHVRAVTAGVEGITLLDTRKTTPGWRVAEKYAVRIGGARNHRLHLGDMVLVKNNHLDGSKDDVAALFKRIEKSKPFYTPVQVEVRSVSELQLIAPYTPDSVLLDNMNEAAIRECVAYVASIDWKPILEVSGRVRPEDAKQMKDWGVHCASTSALIHQATPVDISLRILP